MATTSFAMTVHAIMDYQLDCACFRGYDTRLYKMVL